MSEPKLAWHFLKNGGTLRDGRPAPPDGEWLEHDGYVSICESGLHYSYRALDALEFAPGAVVCRVEVDGIVEEQNDKGVCCRHRILWRADATDTLRAFARWCALQVIDKWDAPDVVRRYLETGDESLRAAAWDAARAAARATARAAAWDAARVAAGDAARDAARDAQAEKLEEMLLALKMARGEA